MEYDAGKSILLFTIAKFVWLNFSYILLISKSIFAMSIRAGNNFLVSALNTSKPPIA